MPATSSAKEGKASGKINTLMKEFDETRTDAGTVSLLKVGSVIVLFLLWVYTTDLLTRDAYRRRLEGWQKWNIILFFSFVGGFILSLFVPWYALSILFVLGGYLGGTLPYVKWRNQQVEPEVRYTLVKLFKKPEKGKKAELAEAKKKREEILQEAKKKKKEQVLETFTDLGMPAKMQEQLRTLLNAPKGLILFSAPPKAGLRTTFRVAFQEADPLSREFVSIEDVHNRHPEMVNLAVATYDSEQGQNPASLFEDLFLQEPNVLVIRDLVSAEVVKAVRQDIARENRVYLSTIHAKDCVDAVARLSASLKVETGLIADILLGVVNQRLVRCLCDECKIAYAPTAEELRRLGIPAGKVKQFYREKVYVPPIKGEKRKDTPCEACEGTGFVGKIAYFELLAPADNFRKALREKPQLDVLRKAAKMDKNLTLQEQAAMLVARGFTSVSELKQGGK